MTQVQWLFLFFITLVFNCFELICGLEQQKPDVNYLDGIYPWERCNSFVGRTVTGVTGVVISHRDYGTKAYKGDRNCVLYLIAPHGYKIKLQILDIEIPQGSGKCYDDSLLIMDLNKELDPQDTQGSISFDAAEKPVGEILGRYCGINHDMGKKMRSKNNGLLIWWNTRDGESARSKTSTSGFRLRWSVFRDPAADEPCRLDTEFQCSSLECIPAGMVCNHVPECDDESDHVRYRQIVMNCDNFSTDFIGSLSGPEQLLFCLGIVMVGAILCGILFLISRCCCRKILIPSNCDGRQIPLSKKPCIPPEACFSNVEQDSRYELLQKHSNFTSNITNNQHVQFAGYYGPPVTPAPSDYAYIQTQPHHIII